MGPVELLNSIKLPFEIPLLLHPPIVHFAIAIPVIVLLLEIANLIVKRKCVGVISSLLLLLATLIYFAAFFTGKTDGSEAYALLSHDGQAELKEHKLLGLYLVYGISLLFILKLIIAAINNKIAKIVFTLLVAIFVGFALKQGKDGGELVYKYGANVQAVSTMDDKIMELEDELDSCKSELKKAKETKPAPAQSTTTVPKAEENAPEQTEPVEQKETASTPAEPKAAAPAPTTQSEPSTIEEKAQEALKQIKGEIEKTTEENSTENAQENNTTEHEGH
ncbi:MULTISPECIES: DUF2231 domain-containing protein [unclassified Nitratiruptor]|uniref:DUF2231 domain-containing protein n=1 Tax=unclassified Nitratiruptor TaxID=2624044 RepID=UPI001914F449|nr:MULTISPECIES: DUF2231 domain-containing protein [unclassified Nitratiruptor]BCD60552.1 hypothetical protein NitYY0810_C1323 [Nitratiruptor sp. YY08-10]BCD64483.1 hypothetical protein NitYY0814_C1330 [Nitratiruptor sp. YY08-14]